MLTKFSRKDISEVKATIEYVNIPKDKILTDTNIKSLTFDLQANRFEAIYYNIKTPKISVDVSANLNPSKKVAIVDKALLESLIANQVNKNLTVRNVSIRELEIELDNIDTKKVKVTPNTAITFKNGFNMLGTPLIEPDSVLLRGPQKLLDSISEISTIEFKRDDIDKSLKVKIPLRSIAVDGVELEDTAVTYSLHIEEFSQKILNVPIRLLNAPSSGTIKIIPNTAEIDFIVSLSLFNEISAKDFVVVCDYSKRNADENFIVPEVVTFPKGIKDVELLTKKVDFLIFK